VITAHLVRHRLVAAGEGLVGPHAVRKLPLAVSGGLLLKVKSKTWRGQYYDFKHFRRKHWPKKFSFLAQNAEILSATTALMLEDQEQIVSTTDKPLDLWSVLKPVFSLYHR
jgi:hypothetical protein